MRQLAITLILVWNCTYVLGQRDIKENVHITTNYSQLISGETLRYSAFCRSELTGKLSPLSKILYVQLIGEDGIVFEQKLRLKNGMGNGEFFINSLIPTGTYQLIAHTLWMKNFDDYFQIPITIINPFESLPEVEKSRLEFTTHVPGENLMLDVPNYVHYLLKEDKNTLYNLKLIGSEGQVLEERQVRGEHSGCFELTPATIGEHKLILESPSGEVSFYPLPAVKPEGYVISVERKNEGIQIEAKHSDNSKNDQLILQLSNLDKPILNRTVFANSTTFIDSEDFSFGLVNVALRKENELITQYSFWNEPLQKTADLGVFNCKESIPVDFELPAGQYSISVKRKNDETSRSSGIIYNYSLNQFRKASEKTYATQRLMNNPEWLSWNYEKRVKDTLLTVQSPDEELTGSEYKKLYNQAKKDLYNVISGKETDKMGVLIKHKLIQEANSGNNNLDFMEVKYLPEAREELLLGTVSGNDGLPIKNEEVYFAIAGKPGQLRTTVTDDHGSFIIQYKSTYSDSRAFLKTKSGEGNFDVVSKFYSEPAPFQYKVPELDSLDVSAIVERSVRNQLFHAYNEIITDANKTSSYFLPQFEEFDFSYNLDDFTRFETFKEYIVEYMLGVSIKGKRIQISQKYFRPDFNEDQLILLDGVPVDESKILDYNPAFIERVGIFNNRFYVGNAAFDGVMYIETFKGNFEGYKDNNLSSVDVIPVLPTNSKIANNQTNSRTPDLRDELYWNPSYKNTLGSLNFDFTTSDVSGEFEINIEGVTKEGNPISKSFKFTVE